MNESQRLWSRARSILITAGGVASGLALWLSLWLPEAALDPAPWPAVVWVSLILVPALGVLLLSLQRQEILLRALGIVRLLAFWMYAGALVTLTYNIGFFLVYILVIAYSLAGLEVLGGVRLARTADAASRDGGLAETPARPSARPEAGLGETVVTPYLGACREPPAGEVKPAREMFPHSSTGPGGRAVLSYLYDAGDAGVQIPEASYQQDADTAPRLRRRARWWVIGAALFANVIAVLSAWGYVLQYLSGDATRTGADSEYLHAPLGGIVLLVPYFAAPLVAFFVGMSAATRGQEGSLRTAMWVGIAMVLMAGVCLTTGPRGGPLPFFAVAYLLGAIAYLHGVCLCRRADDAPGW